MQKHITPKALAELKAKLKGRRTELTDNGVKALRPLSTGNRYEIGDPSLAGFGVRVSGGTGKATYILVARFPGSANPTRREIAKVGEVPLADARATARKWIALVKKGVDPKHEAERERQAKLRKQADTFAAVAELWLKKHAATKRTAKDIERMVRVELLPVLGSRPIAEITKGEVKGLLQAIIDSGRTRTAWIAFEQLRGIYTWAEDQDTYGLENLPTDRIKPKAMFGERKVRTRVLTDTEVSAFWRATGRMGYPHGPLFRLLLLTGARLREIGGASWREIDPENRLLVVPAERFKSDAQHVVPLSSMAWATLDDLPEFTGGDYIFTAVNGERPVSNYAHNKRVLDKLMAKELGYDPPPFVLHDLRRTMRTRLSALKIDPNVAELVIGHGKKGLARIYDQHLYADEVREAMQAWANRLRDIVEPPPPNLVRLGDRASA